jgi:DNA-binding transcriptional ArsR family regulator
VRRASSSVARETRTFYSCLVITVRLDARSLARVRLAPSPASEITSWLRLTATGRCHPIFGEPGSSARYALRDPDVALVASVLPRHGGYVPDMLTPKPPAGPARQTLNRQLELVRETADETVAIQLLLTGRYATGTVPAAARAAMEVGTFARRAASGLLRFWRAALEDQWTPVDAAMATDVAHRARTIAAHGMGAILGGLHPTVAWTGDELHFNKPYTETTDLAGAELVLCPTVLGWPELRVQVCHRDDAVVTYPANGLSPGRPARSEPLSGLLGITRAAILRDLDLPRTTTELGGRHGLAPSTVSHHLGVLLNAGLVVRSRQGALVRYLRSDQGDELVRTTSS